MSKESPYNLLFFLGVATEPTPPDRLLLLERKLKHSFETAYGYKINSVTIVDWEGWRERQPASFWGKLLLGLGVPNTILSKASSWVWDSISDVSSVAKYLKSDEYFQVLDQMNDHAYPIIVGGHSLGTIPALKAMQSSIYCRKLILISPPLGYKRFHKLFNQLGLPPACDIYLGRNDWLSNLIAPWDRKGTEPKFLVRVTYATHDLLDHLREIKNKNWVVSSYGNLFKKIYD